MANGDGTQRTKCANIPAGKEKLFLCCATSGGGNCTATNQHQHIMGIKGLMIKGARGLHAMVCSALLLLAGCADYEFTVNDKLVYTPLPLFNDFALSDPALHTCVSQTIADQKITRAELLESLNCSSAGIRSLEGLAVFEGLQTLVLRDNQLRDANSLRQLPQLQRVDLAENPDLDCNSLANWPQLPAPELTLPRHCRRAP
jgi:hypothetical protein